MSYCFFIKFIKASIISIENNNPNLETKISTGLSQAIHEWLTLSGNRISRYYCEKEITSHADYPAITAVVDFLEVGNMRYQAVEADASFVNEFNYPLVAPSHFSELF